MTDHQQRVLGRGLPKWPQMLVFGEPITVEQAKEIIRRTDTFFSWPDLAGNDRNYALKVMRELRIPGDHARDQKPEVRRDLEFAQDEWRSRWGFLGTNYVHNSWIACSFVGGPHGWCHPDGRMGFVDNIGKHPSSREVMEDWQLLAQEFPFIDLTVVLMDREECEDDAQAVCGFRASGGKVSVFDPLASGPDFVAPKSPDPPFESTPLYDLRNEQGIAWAWIKEWGKLAKKLEE